MGHRQQGSIWCKCHLAEQGMKKVNEWLQYLVAFAVGGGGQDGREGGREAVSECKLTSASLSMPFICVQQRIGFGVNVYLSSCPL